jgi:hypothetical protein
MTGKVYHFLVYPVRFHRSLKILGKRLFSPTILCFVLRLRTACTIAGRLVLSAAPPIAGCSHPSFTEL